MPRKRIIPCLDIKDGRVVKGVNFVDLKDIGNPVEIAARYEEQGADEIFFLNISHEIDYDIIERATKELSIPVAVGGGVQTAHDIREILARNVSKVSLNSALVANPELIGDLSAEFGKRIVAAIDGKMVGGSYRVFVKGGREDTGLDLVQWAKRCEELGAGEILLTSMDGDGTQSGYDIPMTRAVSGAVSIPVIASGGCGSIGDIIKVFNETDCDAALVASLLHYGKATVGEIKGALRCLTG